MPRFGRSDLRVMAPDTDKIRIFHCCLEKSLGCRRPIGFGAIGGWLSDTAGDLAQVEALSDDGNNQPGQVVLSHVS